MTSLCQLLEKAHQLILKAKKHNYAVKSMKKKSRKAAGLVHPPTSLSAAAERDHERDHERDEEEGDGDYEALAAPLLYSSEIDPFPARPPSSPSAAAAAAVVPLPLLMPKGLPASGATEAQRDAAAHAETAPVTAEQQTADPAPAASSAAAAASTLAVAAASLGRPLPPSPLP